MTASAPPKMLFIIDYLSGTRGGTEGQLLALIKGIAQRGLAPRLITLRPTDFTRALDDLGCPFSTLNIRQIASIGSFFRLLRFAWRVRLERIQVVHIFFNDAAVAIPWFAKLGGSKVVASRRDMGFWYTDTNLPFLRLANRSVDRIIANSRAVAAHVEAREWVPRDRIRVIYNGYAFGAEMGPPKPGVREELGIGTTDPIIGIVANLRPVKRHADLLRAFALVRREHPSAHLVLLGEGPLESNLRALAKKLSIDPFVHFLGSIPDVIPVVRHFTVGVLCSESEGFSNALMETMACGVPSVCTRTGGNPELIQEGLQGYLVEVGDVAALAARIASLVRDPTLAREMGERARAKVQEYTIDRMVSAHLNSYSELLSAGGTT